MTDQPIYEYVQAPTICAWDQASLINGPSIESNTKIRLLKGAKQPVKIRRAFWLALRAALIVLCQRRWLAMNFVRISIGSPIIREKIDTICGKILIDHRPDTAKLFHEKLKMDLSEKNINARITKYYELFDKIIEDHGLKNTLGCVAEGHAEYSDRIKSRCKTQLNYE
jgi:hypothetical protein